ncbi:MAG: FkbM family methyltransferase [Candidatus Omnitrophica bacterium]|nr:FkbM family methyltransferase [Candidatus Omnitrophota bacterium]
MITSLVLTDLIQVLPLITEHHAPSDPLHLLLKKVARKEAEHVFKSSSKLRSVEFGPFGGIIFPYFEMGAVSSLNLFDLDELIIFSFYWQNRKRYKNVADVGANIGLHSIVLSRCGFNVNSYEPDPGHYKILKRNLALNRCAHVTGHNSAVSNEAAIKEFVKVLGNTTGSHIAGSRANLYGKLERFPVKTEPIQEIMDWADLVKIDAEGHEKDILLATKRSDWTGTDAMVEVQSQENASAIFKHFKKLKVNLFAQKINWRKVVSEDQMPKGYKDGSLFITAGSAFIKG